MSNVVEPTETPFTLADLEASEVDMAAVQSAIDAIDAGTYGICGVCNNDLAQQITQNPLLLTCEDHLALA
jgi:RNA polymerase-binding transcription factor DksA